MLKHRCFGIVRQLFGTTSGLWIGQSSDENADNYRLSGRVVMQRTATPCTPVRFRPQPPFFEHILISPDGEIGRHKGLKIPRSLRSCRFDSGSGHHLSSQENSRNHRFFLQSNRAPLQRSSELIPALE